MYEITIQQVVYYLSAFAIAGLASVARGRAKNNRVNSWNLLASGASSGLLGFGVVSVLVAVNPLGVVSGWPYLGASALVGGLGVEQDKVASLMLQKVLAIANVIASKEQPKDE